MTKPTTVNLSVTTGDPLLVARIVDTLSRTASGLALDGATCYICVGPEEDVEETSDEGAER